MFEFLADPPQASGPKVMTGHDEGVVTIALVEADPAEREKRRTELDEPYRTPLGHFRHEVGHHYWDVLVRDGGRLQAFRGEFGDDRTDYAAALERYYREGAPANWQDRFVWPMRPPTPGRTSPRPGLTISISSIRWRWPGRSGSASSPPSIGRALTRPASISTLMSRVHRADYRGVDAVRRRDEQHQSGDGRPDLYPFVLAPAVVEKLGSSMTSSGATREKRRRRVEPGTSRPFLRIWTETSTDLGA